MIPLLLVVLGLILGSFVNALVWRIHNKRDWVNERSECTHCHHTLGPMDLIPVVSWLMLGGKCRYCRKKIEDTPLTELAVPTLFVLSYFFWPETFAGRGLFDFIFWLVFLVGFVALAVYDFRWKLLPNKMVFPLVGLAIVQIVGDALIDRDWKVLLTAAAGVAVISGIFYAIFQISQGKWIGGGDVKLGFVLGLLAGGLIPSFLVLFTASVAGLFVSLPAVLMGKANKKSQIPFGPFLILGLIVVKLFGADVIDWYSGLLYV